MNPKVKKYESEILKVVTEKKIIKYSHIFNHYKGISRQYSYEIGLDKSDSIRDAIEQNQQTGKEYLIKKWMQSDNATLQIAAFRLMADKEEHQKLNQQYIDHTTKGDKIHIIIPNAD